MENSKKIILFLLIYLIISCSNNNTKKNNFSSINSLTQYIKIKDILYKDNMGNIYFKTISYGDISEGIKSKDIYIKELILENGDIKELKNIIDTVSFKRLNYIYYKDNNFIFVEIPMNYGSSFFIIEKANAKMFKNFGESYYAKDNNYCYYKGKKIEGANPIYFNILAQKDSNINTIYAKDNKYYYKENDTISFNKIKYFIK